MTSSCVRQQPQEVIECQDGEIRPAAAQMGTMLDIGARSIFTADHDMFREQVRRWMKERLAPLQNSFEENGQPSKEIWKEMGDQVTKYFSLGFFCVISLSLCSLRNQVDLIFTNKYCLMLLLSIKLSLLSFFF